MGGFTDVLALFEGLQFEKNQCAISVSTDDPNLPVDNFLGSFDDFFDRHPALNDLCISYVTIHDGKKWFLTYNRRCLDQTEIWHEYDILKYDHSNWKFIQNVENKL